MSRFESMLTHLEDLVETLDERIGQAGDGIVRGRLVGGHHEDDVVRL